MLNRNYPKWDSVTKLTETEFKQLDLHDYNTFAVVTIKIKRLRLKDDGVPCFPKKSAFGMSREIMSECDLADDTVILTNFDLYWIMQNYKLEYEYVTGVIARNAINHPFTSFILKHKAEKERAVQAGNKVDKMIAKIHLNSTYGKFAQRKITTKTVLMQNSNGTIGFTEEPDLNAKPTDHNILIAVFITAFARDVLLSMIELLKHEPQATFWYCDTDSVHFGYNGDLDIVKDDEKIFGNCISPLTSQSLASGSPSSIWRKPVI